MTDSGFVLFSDILKKPNDWWELLVASPLCAGFQSESKVFIIIQFPFH